MNSCSSPANPALTALLTGHQAQAKMRAIFASVNALYRTVADGMGPVWRARPRRHTWQQTVSRIMMAVAKLT